MSAPILVCGLEHVIVKIARHYATLRAVTGREVVIYSRDVTGFSAATADAFALRWIPVPGGALRDAATFAHVLREVRPAHVELYHDARNPLVYAGYVAAARAARVPIVTVCRGSELRLWEEHSAVRRVAFRFGLQSSALVLYKELHMPERLRALGIPRERTHFMHNRVLFSADEPAPPADRRHVLFLNGWKPRRPDIAVEVGVRLADRYPEVEFRVVGERQWSAVDAEIGARLRARLTETGMQERVQLLPFVEDPAPHFADAAIFLLPSEIVYLNYTLLEAMERGLVPVVARRDGAERVIDDGESGLLVDLSAEAFTEAVDRLLTDEAELDRLARGSRRAIRERFDLRAGLEEVADLYASLVW